MLMKLANDIELDNVEDASQDTGALQRFLKILLTWLESWGKKQAHLVILKLKILDWV